MFVFAETPTFTHDVKVLTPVDEGHKEQILKTTFKYLPSDEVAKFDLMTEAGTTDFLKAIVVGMHGLVAAETGAPLAYSDELRDKMFRRTDVRKALGNHFLAAIAKVPEGN